MKKIAEMICQHKIMIVILSAIFLILSFVGMSLTCVNYDILVYLPQNIETIQGQDILTDDFHMGSYSIAVVEHMKGKDVLELEQEILSVPSVNQVISLYDVLGTSIPIEVLPNDILDKVHKNDTDLLFITFAGSTSSEETIQAVSEIRKIADGKIHQGGMSSMVLDTMNLSEQEIIVYIVIAVLLCILVLELALDSYLVPFLLLLNIGCAILFNLGTNIFLGEISYITKALVAVLQLGVTTDFSIFLYHSYEKKKEEVSKDQAMIEAIKETFTSVIGSSFTTIAGFLVLCTMNLTLGKDLGIVMAKGVFLGVVCVLTLFPSLLLLFDRLVEKTKHKKLIFDFSKLHQFVIRHNVFIFILFLALFVPIYLANSKVDVYYKLDRSLPSTLESIKTNTILKEHYHIVSPEIILVDRDLKSDEVVAMVDEIERMEGIDFALSFAKLEKLGITENMLDDDLLQFIKNDRYQMILVNSLYDIATDELNKQIEEIDTIVKEYDSNGIIAGEGPLMKDLVHICDTDFKNVNTASIVCIFIILFFVLKSLSLPFLLIAAIEFAIFTNMSISYFGGVTLPFIASIVLGTIQLGATIDYAILLTTTYIKKRNSGLEKRKAMLETLNYCGNSVFTSGMCFFAATFGVGIYSKIEMIGSLCSLISRGAIISMLVVITVLPSILLIFDTFIMKTTLKGKEDSSMKKKKILKQAMVCSMILLTILSTTPISVFALDKKETVYSKLNFDGSVQQVFVNEQLLNPLKKELLEDYTELDHILCLSKDCSFTKHQNGLSWTTLEKDVFYQGTSDKKMPIDLKITYQLDGKEMKLDDMLGKSGQVTITLQYLNHDAHEVLVHNHYETLYTPFVVTMATMIDVDHNTNFSITNGKIVSNGTKNIIVGVSAPGLYESLNVEELKGLDTITISYETTKFELASIYSVATPKFIEESDLDIFEKVHSVSTQVDQLQSNMNLLDDGAKKVKEGSTKLKEGLASSIEDLKQNPAEALSVEQLEQIKNQTLSSVQSTFTDSYKQVIADAAWREVQQSLSSSQDDTVENYVKEAVSSLLKTYLGTDENFMYYGGCVQGNQDACVALGNSGYDIDKVIEFQNKMALEIANVAQKTTNYVSENVSKRVSIEVSEKSAIEAVSNVVDTLVPNVANQVLHASLGMVSESLQTLYQGVSTLDQGIHDLSDGISKYNVEGIHKISELVHGKVEGTVEKIQALIKLGDSYESFANKLDTSTGETKFILVVDSKKIPEPVKKAVTESKKTSFWERIKNLFR